MTQGHGDDVFRYGDRVKYNFSTNIHQNVDHGKLIRHIEELGDIFRNYPEPEPQSVEAMLAETLDVGKDNVLVSNGATEAIYLIAHRTEGKNSAIVVPTFREYQDACKVFGHDIAFISSPSEIPADSDIVWICNPNNPTGQAYDADALGALIAENQERLFVLDQAYADYSIKATLSPRAVFSLPNVIILYSLTKRFAIPGLRIGYAVGSKNIIDSLRRLRMPWSVNSIAIEAAKYLIDHRDKYRIDAVSLHNEALRISDALESLGIHTFPTDCNFLLASLPNGTSAQLKDRLVENCGILIRDASNFETLDGSYFRVAAQTRHENDLLIKSIEEWMRS